MSGEIVWMPAEMCAPPHRVTHPDRLADLITAIERDGWNGPMLLGYWLDGKVQLISGSHRWAAATALHRQLPVWLHDYEYIRGIYGTHEWMELMAASILNPIVEKR